MTTPSYATHRTHYHLIAAAFLLISGGIGLFIFNALIEEVHSHPPRILLEPAPFAMPFALLMVPVLLVLELMNRRGKWLLPKHGGVALLVLLGVFIMGGKSLAEPRFKEWLAAQGYERCEAFDHQSRGSRGSGKTYEAWVQRGACEKYATTRGGG